MLQPHALAAWGLSRPVVPGLLNACASAPAPSGRKDRALIRATVRISKDLATTTQQLRTPDAQMLHWLRFEGGVVVA